MTANSLNHGWTWWMTTIATVWCMALACCFSTCFSSLATAQQTPRDETVTLEPALPKRIESKLLPNAHWIHANLLSGGMPHGEAAFQELASMGIQTIISVDGIKPDVASAEKFGLRTIHLPHGYDGIAAQRVLELAKAMRDSPKPIYLHCHHGKHRGPTAAAAGCITNGWLPPQSADPILRTAGTNPAFAGLYRTARTAKKVDAEVLDALEITFQSVATVPPIIESMVAIDEVWERLKQSQSQGWKGGEADPRSDALMLKEHYVELRRTESATDRETAFLQLIDTARILSETLEDQLIHARSERLAAPSWREQTDASMKRLGQNCLQCHTQFRDVPRSK